MFLFSWETDKIIDFSFKRKGKTGFPYSLVRRRFKRQHHIFHLLEHFCPFKKKWNVSIDLPKEQAHLRCFLFFKKNVSFVFIKLSLNASCKASLDIWDRFLGRKTRVWIILLYRWGLTVITCFLTLTDNCKIWKSEFGFNLLSLFSFPCFKRRFICVSVKLGGLFMPQGLAW